MAKKYSTSIIDNIKDLKRIYKKFVQPKTIYDLWELKACFYDDSIVKEIYAPHLQEGNKTVGLIPLWKLKNKEQRFWYGENTDYYEQFGGFYTDINRFYLDTPEHMSHLLPLFKSQTIYWYVLNNDYKYYKRYFLTLFSYNYYVLPVGNLSFESYMKSFINRKAKFNKYKNRLKRLTVVEEFNLGNIEKSFQWKEIIYNDRAYTTRYQPQYLAFFEAMHKHDCIIQLNYFQKDKFLGIKILGIDYLNNRLLQIYTAQENVSDRILRLSHYHSITIAYNRKYKSLDSMSTGKSIFNEDYGFSIYPSYIILLA